MYWDGKEHAKFEVSVKALIFKDGKLFFAKDDKGKWDLPGGRIDEAETVQQCLEREVLEELGVKIKTIEARPAAAELINYDDNTKRFMLVFKIETESFNFKPSEENRENRFISKDEFEKLEQAYSGLKTIKDKIFIN